MPSKGLSIGSDVFYSPKVVSVPGVVFRAAGKVHNGRKLNHTDRVAVIRISKGAQFCVQYDFIPKAHAALAVRVQVHCLGGHKRRSRFKICTGRFSPYTPSTSEKPISLLYTLGGAVKFSLFLIPASKSFQIQAFAPS